MTDMACPSTLTDAFSVTPPERMLELDEATKSLLPNFFKVTRKEKNVYHKGKMPAWTSSELGCSAGFQVTDEVIILGFSRFGFMLRERMEVSVGLSCLVDSVCSPKLSTKFTTVYVVTPMRSTRPNATSNPPSALHDDMVNNIAVLYFRTRRKLNQFSPIAKKNPPRVINLSTRQLSAIETSMLSRRNISSST